MRGTPQQVAAEIKRRAQALAVELRKAEMISIAAVQSEAKRLSKGSFSTEALNRMGNPYARRRPRPPADPAMINLQTGDFLRGWRRKTGTWRGGVLTCTAFNISPHAELLEKGGTSSSLMIARPLVQRVLQSPALRAGRKARLRDAIRKVL